ncbi:hypothetical protein RhiirA1_470841 [Rhizophagus irregularis]|uniref:Crinkler family protein n=1 Tax=Rhizophagus irregularis TaxID=588596 RepID=A0A2N0R5C1_9GLOM|nr:hypothetical protein RhiirA1_470841 [Rhizophagus irregularis]
MEFAHLSPKKLISDEPISELKEAIKAKKAPEPTRTTCHKKDFEILPDSPAEECIHVIVEPPASTATSNREQELLDQVASLQALLNKSVHGFGQGNLDYAVECRPTGRVLGVIEVKKEDFMKGFAQASVQMESTLSRKRKADEIDDGRSIDRVFGIVTDASEWWKGPRSYCLVVGGGAKADGSFSKW